MPGAAYTNSCALAGRLSATGYMDIAALLLPAATYSAVSGMTIVGYAKHQFVGAGGKPAFAVATLAATFFKVFVCVIAGVFVNHSLYESVGKG